MSNFLAIATVTASLGQMIQAAISLDLSGATVTNVVPDSTNSAALPTTGVNVFLYQVTHNNAWRNNDLPARRQDGQLVQRPQAALDLNYLLTFYGSDTQLEPQRLLGTVVRTLHARPLLTRDVIRKTISLKGFEFLVNSNLIDDVELIKFTPLSLSLEELSKLWSVYFQTSYHLSIAYQASVVLIESEDTVRPALPVRARNIYVKTFRQPFIEQIISKAGVDQPIVAGSTLLIQGQRLRGDITQTLIGGIPVQPDPQGLSDTQLSVALPAGLRAGVQGAQVVQPQLLGTPPVAHTGVESNLAAFVLHPTINKKNNAPDIDVSTPVVAGDGTRTANVTVKLSPKVGKSQHVSFLLNELNPTTTRPARSYSFQAPAPKQNDPEETDTIVFHINGVQPGDYLARVQVDGAISPLEQSTDVNNPLFIGPKVTIP